MSVQRIANGEFESTIAQGKSIVKYYADWCGSCKLISPKFRRLSEDDKYAGIQFLDVNAEENETARKAAGVDNLPFFALFEDGKFLEGSAMSKIEKVEEMLEKFNS